MGKPNSSSFGSGLVYINFVINYDSFLVRELVLIVPGSTLRSLLELIWM